MSEGKKLSESNDLSDEAYKKWYDEEAVPSIQLLSTYTSARFAEAAWQECRKRAEGRERKAHQHGFYTGQMTPRGSIYDGESAEPQSWLAYKQEQK